mmetsp:Transcript_39144/g.57756  ORF Transcript_39144/g.57756 Transcript_39144/m.57756 type:complete len:508 (-) Transcript_39144:6-1529(-)|eukprot:scaffold13838_cov104-Skeletonema_dohrnii-CCMP3373.AAC.7
MFQRRMILVANRLPNAQLKAPQLFSKKKQQQQQQQEQPPATTSNNGDTTTDFDAIALNLRNKSRSSHQRTQSCLNKIRRNFIYVAFVLYLLVGTLFYMYDPGNEVHGVLAYYQAITIGFSVGLGTKDPTFVPDVWFSSLYILCGAAIIAVMLTVAGNQVEEAASMSMFESLQRRENYENQMTRDNPLKVRIYAFLAYNSAYLISIFAWVLWLGFIMCWAMLQVPEWDFGRAQYFAVSLCSSAGSFSLPTTASNAAYGLAGVSMMIGVPLMAMGISSIIIMLWQGHRFQKVKLAAWEDVSQEELKLLNELGVVDIGEGDRLTKGGFILLGLLRMGQEVGVMKYLADAFEAIEDRGGVIIRKASDGNKDGNGYYSKHAQAYVGGCPEDEEDEMPSMSSEASRAATLFSKESTAATAKRGKDDRSWSISVGVDSSTSRQASDLSGLNSSGLSNILSGGIDLGPIDEAEDNNGAIPSRLDSDAGTIPSRLGSDFGTTGSIEPRHTWEFNNP